MSGFGSFFGPGNEIGVILVLFILIAVIACSCYGFAAGGGV
ncbi:sporulation protein YjcZ [Aneurinibacillus terranovensis]|nr:sporulation protein YjcZ [Aneurinibacillus terranovensis]